LVSAIMDVSPLQCRRSVFHVAILWLDRIIYSLTPLIDMMLLRIMLSVFALLIAITSVFAQANKLLVPFSSPFLMNIQVNETDYDTSWHSFVGSARIGPDTVHDMMTVYPFDTVFSRFDSNILYMHSDTLKVVKGGAGMDISESYKSFLIVFDSSHNNAIKELTYLNMVSGARNNISNINQGVTLIDLRFDSSGIYFSDSGYSQHVSSVWRSQGFNDLNDGGNIQLISVSSIDLSGIFHSTHLENSLDLVSNNPPSQGLSINLVKGYLDCSFSQSDHSRVLEVYTPIGVKAASLEITAGCREISLPRLASGLYFLRVGGEMLKVAVP